MAGAPAAVYFSRYYIQETLLVAFTLGTFVCVREWWRRGGGVGWAVAAGACTGLMQASKASAPLFLLAAALALLVTRPRASGCIMDTRRLWRRDLPLALGTALGIAAVFYSSFFTHAAGLKDAFLTYFPAGDRVTSGAGHAKPWNYYPNLFLPQTIGGYHWNQVLFLVLAAGGVSACAWAPVDQRPRLRFWAAYTLLLGLFFSVVPYKTPWLVVHLVAGLALLGGGLLGALAARRLRGTIVAAILLSLTTAAQWRQTNLAVYLRPGDARNLLAYVHASPDVRKVRPLVDEALARGAEGPIRVISREIWPLPWYLRGLDDVGYWSEPPAECDGAVVVVGADQADAVRSRLTGTYEESFLGLRPGFVLIVFTRQP